MPLGNGWGLKQTALDSGEYFRRMPRSADILVCRIADFPVGRARIIRVIGLDQRLPVGKPAIRHVENVRYSGCGPSRPREPAPGAGSLMRPRAARETAKIPLDIFTCVKYSRRH